MRAPALIISRRGDPVHPEALGHILAEVLSNADLIVLDSEDDLMASIPMLVQRVATFLAGEA